MLLIILIFLLTVCAAAPLNETSSEERTKRANCAIYRRGVQKETIQEILDAHNALRQYVAYGYQNGQPQAANMRLLHWDKDLAQVAQELADKCVLQHDVARHWDSFPGGMGQNLRRTTSWYFEEEPEFQRGIESWYSEVYMMDRNKIKKFVFDSRVSHYTQMMWAETNRIGCGYTFYKDGARTSKLYVCNYSPGGNVIDDEMYSEGTACSKCPTKCSSVWDGLCE